MSHNIVFHLKYPCTRHIKSRLLLTTKTTLISSTSSHGTPIDTRGDQVIDLTGDCDSHENIPKSWKLSTTSTNAAASQAPLRAIKNNARSVHDDVPSYRIRPELLQEISSTKASKLRGILTALCRSNATSRLLVEDQLLTHTIASEESNGSTSGRESSETAQDDSEGNEEDGSNNGQEDDDKDLPGFEEAEQSAAASPPPLRRTISSLSAKTAARRSNQNTTRKASVFGMKTEKRLSTRMQTYGQITKIAMVASTALKTIRIINLASCGHAASPPLPTKGVNARCTECRTTMSLLKHRRVPNLRKNAKREKPISNLKITLSLHGVRVARRKSAPLILILSLVSGE